ncbi:Os02g0158200 [Oryza sativa Japonica Group]|uniref:Os02g0158200 protein n=1 Tax=Oryza sativa subsp. japonica TaxID=39947 RepID=A0A0P0VEY6_ORYSJ|nr:hypothetical protein EE612_008976 [Oryza sativa]BAS77075.1 Os02g0158200 [Oryza sativa Japonica Group]
MSFRSQRRSSCSFSNKSFPIGPTADSFTGLCRNLPDINTRDLRGIEYFPKRPHQCTIHSHKLLSVNLVCLIQHYTYFVIMAT